MSVPEGLIVIWSGTLASIPANWSLCDGNGGTPNLVARFLRGAPATTNPGSTGGADTHDHSSMTSAGSHSHTLASKSHNHTTGSAGAHDHGVIATNSGSNSIMASSAGAHTHGTGSASHTHGSGTDANHTHTINASDGRPPYYEVAFIRAGAGAAIDAGIVIIWTGTLATIPAGWALCDGGSGRPDLRSRFLRGVNTAATNPGSTGGATTHTHTTDTISHTHGGNSDYSGGHTHSFSSFTWTHSHNASTGAAVGMLFTNRQTDSAAGNHTHSNTNDPGTHRHTIGSGGSHSHTGGATSSLPAYYTVAYIVNESANAIPLDGILIWTGTLATIPANYDLCDGGGGRPELRSRFLYGAASGSNPGSTGGSDSHTHTPNTAGAHSNHSIGSTGAHTHSSTNTTGAHTHSRADASQGTTGTATLSNASGGDHSHSFSSEDSHNHTLDSQGGHTHSPWSTDEGLPAYYEVAFVICTSLPTPVTTKRGAFFMVM